jgi:4-aminobutyrate aminotransferase
MKNRSDFPSLIEIATEILPPPIAGDWPLLPITRAEGIYLHTPDGRKIMDFIAGFAVTNVGHNHPKVVESAKKQMDKICHSAMGVVLHEPLLQLTETLPLVLPKGLEMPFFCNSGAEAIEGALKLARYVTRRPAIIAFEGGFHGRTFGAASVSSVKSKYRRHLEPFVPGIYFADYAYPYRCPLGADPKTVIEWSLESIQKIFDRFAQPSDVAAFLVEPIQGEGGYVIPPADWLKELRTICDQHGILLIFDEIQTGFGRTGHMFASQAFGAPPDIMAIAKGIANGFPMGAIVASREIMGQWPYGSHGTTYGGNPVACAAALATLEVIEEENLLENCRNMGEIFLDGLLALQEKYPIIGEVRGLGLMVAMELIVPGEGKIPNPRAVADLLEGCLERGLLATTAGLHGHVIRFMPPLSITEDQVKEGLRIIEESLESL